MVENKEVELTEHEAELYDRQIRLWGLESQKRLRAANVLLCGLSGIGAEIAKNIILAGVKSVVFLDHREAKEEDSCSQFFIPVTAKGENRAEASLQRARSLNPMVEVTADKEELGKKTEEFFKKFDVVIVTGAPTAELVRIDKICRDNKLKFFACDVWGMFGYSFQDLLEHEFVKDVIKHKIIEKKDNTVKTELIAVPRKDTMKFPPFQTVLNFDFKTPAYVRKMKRSGAAFVVLRILQTFRDKFDRDPNPAIREDDLKEIFKIQDEIASGLLVGDAAFNHVFAQISPAAAIVGGQLAQEVIKAVSQKDAPFRNVFLFDPQNCCGFIEDIGSH